MVILSMEGSFGGRCVFACFTLGHGRIAAVPAAFGGYFTGATVKKALFGYGVVATRTVGVTAQNAPYSKGKSHKEATLTERLQCVSGTGGGKATAGLF
jgi:hypothetical protein